MSDVLGDVKPVTLVGEDCPVPKAFGIPIYFYNQFMEENGFWDEIDAMLDDPVMAGGQFFDRREDRSVIGRVTSRSR